MTVEQRGHIIERLTGHFTGQFFMKDFVFLNPYYTSGGVKKELADLLLVLDDECCVLSLKGTDGEEKADDKLRRWLRKKTRQGSQSAKTGMQRLSKVRCMARNLWDEERTFDPGSLKTMASIVILECSQQPFGSIEFAVEQPKSQFPIHVISLDDFLNVVNWLGSIWDVFDYFSKRAAVRHTFTGINQERPLFAYYMLESKTDFLGFTHADKMQLGERHQLHLLDNLRNYEERDRYAQYVNAVVHELHTRDPKLEEYCPEEFKGFVEPEHRRTHYLEMAAMLNALPSSNKAYKAYIGRKLESLIKHLKDSGQADCFPHKRLYEKPVLVFAVFSQVTQTELIRRAHEMLLAALYRFSTDEGLVVGLDADDDTSGFHLQLVRGWNDFEPTIQALGYDLFPSLSQTLVPDPFGRTRPYEPEHAR